MTIKELVEKYGFTEISPNIFRLCVDDCETIELYQISVKSAYYRHGCEGDVFASRDCASNIDHYIHEALHGCGD